MFFSFSLVAAAAAAPVCREAVPSARVEQVLQQAEAAYAAADVATFTQGRNAALQLLPCLSEPISRGAAREVHVVMAYAALAGGDRLKALHALRSVLAITPDWAPPEAVLVASPALAGVLADARAAPLLPPTSLPRPAGTTLLVDGMLAAGRAQDRPVVVQLSTASGGVIWSAYDAPLPTPEVLAELERKRKR